MYYFGQIMINDYSTIWIQTGVAESLSCWPEKVNIHLTSWYFNLKASPLEVLRVFPKLKGPCVCMWSKCWPLTSVSRGQVPRKFPYRGSLLYLSHCPPQRNSHFQQLSFPTSEKITPGRKFGRLAPHEKRGQLAKTQDLALTRLWTQPQFNWSC